MNPGGKGEKSQGSELVGRHGGEGIGTGAARYSMRGDDEQEQQGALGWWAFSFFEENCGRFLLYSPNGKWKWKGGPTTSIP